MIVEVLRNISIILIFFSFFVICEENDIRDGCNEMVCSGIVTKCLINGYCKCDVTNAKCNHECSNCMAKLWRECCSCVDLCKSISETKNASLISKTGFFHTIIPQLYHSLVSEPDTEDRWTSFTFPAEFDKTELPSDVISDWPADVKHLIGGDRVILNCTVAYWNHCMPEFQCGKSCQSMGAHRYRWFEDGCCECVGYSCPNYGIDESRCPKCSGKKESYDIDELDYGEDDDTL